MLNNNGKITFKKNEMIEAMDIYGNPTKGVINGFIGSLGYATIKIEGVCGGTTVDLNNNSVRKIEDN
jgi:hypothetical protein